MNDQSGTSTTSALRTLGKVVLLLVLTAFGLMGLCGGVFSVMDLASAKPGHNEYVGPIPYVSLGVGLVGAWVCWWLFQRLRRKG
jgi:hypothetical protein